MLQEGDLERVGDALLGHERLNLVELVDGEQMGADEEVWVRRRFRDGDAQVRDPFGSLRRAQGADAAVQAVPPQLRAEVVSYPHDQSSANNEPRGDLREAVRDWSALWFPTAGRGA